MGVYNNDNGVLSPIAGRGKAEYGASTVRTGTVTIPEDTTAGSFRVTFSDAMPDSNYIVNWCFDDCADGDAGRLVGAINSDANGFWLYYFGGFTKDVIIKYTAFKLYTDTEYNGLLNNQRYSTSEINTGKTWIDGKPIYRKVVIIDGADLKTDFSAMTLIGSGVETLVHGEIYVLRGDGAWFGPTSFDNGSGDTAQMLLYADGTRVLGFCKATWGGVTIIKFRAVLEYTKTS